MSACAKAQRWEDGLELFGEMRSSRLLLDVIVYGSLVTACEKAEQWEQASRVFGQIQPRLLEPDVINYNATLSACSKGEPWEQASGLLGQMQPRVLEPDVISCSPVVNACDRAGAFGATLLVLEEMRLRALDPIADALCAAAAVAAVHDGRARLEPFRPALLAGTCVALRAPRALESSRRPCSSSAAPPRRTGSACRRA